MEHQYLKMISDGIPVIFDGAVGTEIQKAGVGEEFYAGSPGCNEILNVTRPDVLIAIHQDYLRAGVHVIQTNTFGGSRPKLKEYKLESRVYDINKAAASNARMAVDSFLGEKPLFVCGSMGPTGYLPSSKNKDMAGVPFDELVEIYVEQCTALIDGGVDLLRIETSQDLLEVRAAICGIRNVFKQKQMEIPFQVQITLDTNGFMLLGSNIEAFLGAVTAMGPCAVGINCGAGPVEMTPSIRKLLQYSPLPVAALPNAGMPQNNEGKAVYKLGPDDFAEMLEPLVTKEGLSIVGGCCGTTPDHLRALANHLKNKVVGKRETASRSCWLSTGINGLNIEDVKRPIIIGERLNTQGSKKTKEHVLAKNFDELYQIAAEQARSGSTLLDICVAVNESDTEQETMKEIVSFLSDRCSIPFCIDSTEPSVIAEALRSNPGSVMINSINLEQGAAKARKILELAVRFGCPVIALPIDDEGMAKTLDKKLELTRVLYKIACEEYGLPANYLYIDPLVFTLATGDKLSADAAVVSMDAIRKIKSELPGIRTVMGVSNVSFGLKPKARRILNNLMLYHAVKAGLDAAIFNPLHLDNPEIYSSEVKKLGEDLLFNSNENALSSFVDYFETNSVVQESALEKKSAEELSPERRLQCAVVSRDKRDLGNVINILLEKRSAHDILNNILLPAMSEVGDKMSSGEMILPFVLQAAEVMKEAVTILEPCLKNSKSSIKGKIILATVYGDVHDIGKNLVGSIFRNQGYDVIDLGKQVPVSEIVAAVKREKPDAVGLSALLVTTSKQMKLCVEEFDKEGLKVPVFIGGAAVNREFASRIEVIDSHKYQGGVFFAKDAFEASRLLENLENAKDTKDVQRKSAQIQSVATTCESSATPIEYGPHIEPPFWGTSDLLTWETEVQINSINKERLFKAEWGGGKLTPDKFKEIEKNEFLPSFEALRKEIIENELIDIRGFYGFFPVITDNDKLIILSPNDFSTEVLTFTFPRMPRKHNRCIADYFRPEGDIISVQVVTIGHNLGERCRQYFQKEGKYSKGYLLNGIGNYLVENTADKITSEIKRAMGLDMSMGRRYSFGYPGLPSLEDQKQLFEFIGAEERLGITMTSGFQMVPEHSTMGIYVHHPKAEYLG